MGSTGFVPKAVGVLVVAALAGAAIGWFRQTVGASVPGTTFVGGALIGWLLAPREGSHGTFTLVVVALFALSLVTVPAGVVTAGELYAQRIAAETALAMEAPGGTPPVMLRGIRWGTVFGLLAMPILAGTGLSAVVGWYASGRDDA